MFRPLLSVPPAENPVTIEQLKDQIPGLSFDDDDGELAALLSAAISHFDGYSGRLGRCLMPQTWTLSFSEWRSKMLLPFPDVTNVGISFWDEEGAQKSIAQENLELVSEIGADSIVFPPDFAFPSLDQARSAPITVTLTAGYANADAVPFPIRQAIIIAAKSWYDGQEALPIAVDLLTKPYQVLRL
ncbi:MAG: head-tail connector protein [Cognatishimia activa]